MKKVVAIGLVVLMGVLLFHLRGAKADGHPYGGNPWPIPGTIEAENYDLGGQGVGYSVANKNGTANTYRSDGVNIERCDDSSGYNLGWAEPGDWFHYTVAVKEPGHYSVGFRVASALGGGALHLSDAAGRDLSGPVSIPSTGGWQNWTTVYANVSLPAGEQCLTLVEDTSENFNINYLSFHLGDYVPPAPTGLTARPVGSGVTLMWTAENGSVSYSIYRGSRAGGEGAKPIATGIKPPRYTDERLGAESGQYYYQVTAVASGQMSDKSQEVEAALGGPGTAQTPDFGPGVLVFDPQMPSATIQSQVDAVYSRQQTSQFGPDRYAFLFKPGEYKESVKVGFYTQVLGLGQSPDDTLIDGRVQTDADWMGGNATVNFWRGAENLAIAPEGGSATWAVSQACPIRRLHVKGNLRLFDYGWSSGGFLSDSLIDGEVVSGSQQQWFTRNSAIGRWSGAVWNMVFVGVDNAPPASFPRPPYTVVERAPVTREKPFLTIDDHGGYGVFVPALRRGSQGTTWSGGAAAGKTIPIGRFYIAHPETDTAASINAALGAGKNLLLTPGIYRVSEPIRVTRAGTVVLGLGLATIQPQGGVDAMDVADIDGVVLAGLLFDAGAVSSPALLRVGSPGSTATHSSDPTSLHDIFFRVGGAAAGRATVSLQIDSSDVIADDLWLWRADHGNGVGWNVNTAANGLVVNGADVTIYGLAVEHYQTYQTLWNGNGGRLYFYQSEEPYDVPDQGSWMNGPADGFASYKVANGVTSHEAWGLGVYCVFTNPSVTLERAIEAPRAPGVIFHNMTTISLGGKGTIAHVANTAGDAAEDGSSRPVTLARYP